MISEWDAYFRNEVSTDAITGAVEKFISDGLSDAEHIEDILLRDMIPELAFVITTEKSELGLNSFFLTSANNNFSDIALHETSQFASFARACDRDLISEETLAVLSTQSTGHSILSQIIEVGDDTNGTIISAVPIGFDAYASEASPKIGLFARLIGGRT